ncbi:MAG: GIY-YIG nuclease family protein [Lentimicrobium sp.]|nr:GIY-YIG nuclease family protein [Lentimicrobium sp.]
MYAIIDVETTGGSFANERLTEIAVYLHDGNCIVDEFSTLLNPEQPIPYMITRITGINDEMVANAPRFYEVAKKIVEMTEGATFVGHNASFDYNFIKQEFKRLGYNYRRPTLCTVKMSRRILPGMQSYSLGRLCQDLGINLENRHRAAGDALATTRLLELLLKTDRQAIEKQSGSSVPEMLREVPEETGVYYMHDESGKIIYIGKSTNMFGRLLQHFRNSETHKAVEMRNRTTSVSYEHTGSELLALLLESDEIKKHKPIFNRAQRRSIFSYGLFEFTDENGYRNLFIGHQLNGKQAVTSFTSMDHARNYLYGVVEKFELCQKLCGLYDTKGACFQFGIKQCRGACVGLENPELYNRRADAAIRLSGFMHPDFFIIDKGRSNGEAGVVKVAAGLYCGIGYIDTCESINQETLNNCIKSYDDNRDTRQIIQTYLKKNPRTKIIKVKSQEINHLD